MADHCASAATEGSGVARRQPEHRIALVGAALCAGALVTAVLMPTAAAAEGPVLCPFRLVTGLPCPGCGLTRSWVALAHGQVGEAFAYNWFGPVSFVAAALFTLVTVAALVRRRPPRLPARLMRPVLLYAVAGAWIGYGVVRLVLTATGAVSPVV